MWYTILKEHTNEITSDENFLACNPNISDFNFTIIQREEQLSRLPTDFQGKNRL